MKITQSDYESLRNKIAEVYYAIPEHDLIVMQARFESIAKEKNLDSDKMLAWEVFHRANSYHLYSYLNDSHIETAIMRIMGELEKSTNMEKRTHSHLYRYENDWGWVFAEAITFENWRNENEQSYNFILLKYEYDCNEEEYIFQAYYIWVEDITKGWFTIYKVNHSLTDYETQCPFCTGHFQENN